VATRHADYVYAVCYADDRRWKTDVGKIKFLSLECLHNGRPRAHKFPFDFCSKACISSSSRHE